MDAFAAGMEQAEGDGYDMTLVDTQGGGSDLNNAILVNAHLVVVPTSLSPLDIDSALDTLEYLDSLYKREGDEVPIGVLLQRMPVGNLTRNQRADLKTLGTVPQFVAQFPERDAYRSIKARGLLHRCHAKLTEQPLKHIATALRESDAFAAEMLAAIEEVSRDAV